MVAVKDDYCLVLSCRHVCMEVGLPVHMTWSYAGGQTTVGVVLHVVKGRDFGTDLALILSQKPKGPLEPIKIGKVDEKNGPWVSAGYRGGKFVVTYAENGYISGPLLFTDAYFIGGMSGGCTFDRHGRLVAVIVASDRRTTGISVDGPKLHAMLKMYGYE